MKCCKCDKNYGRIMITLEDANQKQTFCPNCLRMTYAYDELELVNDKTLIDDVTGEKGAVTFTSHTGEETYVLEAERMKRLIEHNLTPEEYFALAQKYGEHCYEIHDDFYTEDGIAIQPMH